MESKPLVGGVRFVEQRHQLRMDSRDVVGLEKCLDRHLPVAGEIQRVPGSESLLFHRKRLEPLVELA